MKISMYLQDSKTEVQYWEEGGRNSSRGGRNFRKCGSQRICPQIYRGIF